MTRPRSWAYSTCMADEIASTKIRVRPSTRIRILGRRIIKEETIDGVLNRALDALDYKTNEPLRHAAIKLAYEKDQRRIKP